jgi:hypothetical protein
LEMIESNSIRMELRYAYYRRCQVLRRNGEQCKAPAEQGAHICYAHARQNAMQQRRAREREAVLEEAAQRIRMHPMLSWKCGKRSRITDGVGDVSADLHAIQVTLAAVTQAIIDGRIDNKTAGRLCWELQIASKLLWLKQRTSMAARRRRSPAFREFDVPINIAEQILRPGATVLNHRSGDASSATGWQPVTGTARSTGILLPDEKFLDRPVADEKAA